MSVIGRNSKHKSSKRGRRKDAQSSIVKLAPLLNEFSFTTKEANALGVSSAMLRYYSEKKLIKRLMRGVYQANNISKETEFEWEELVIILKSIEKGVVCLATALSLYELSDDIPRQFWIAIPDSCRARDRKFTRTVRMRDMETGKTSIKIGDVDVPIFNVERTIVDAFRLLDQERSIKSLKYAIQKNIVDIPKLTKYAKKFNVKLDNYIKAFQI